MKNSTIAAILQALLVGFMLQKMGASGWVATQCIIANAVLIVAYGAFRRNEED